MLSSISNHLPKSGALRTLAQASIISAAAFGAYKIITAVTGKISVMRQQSAREERKKTQKPGVVYVFVFPHTKDGNQFSLPCAKVETYLKLKKIPYECVETMDPNVNFKTERLPFIELDGEGVADSKYIIEFLEQKFSKVDDLDREQESKLSALIALSDSARFSHYRCHMVDNIAWMKNFLKKNMDLGSTPTIFIDMFMDKSRQNIINMLNSMGHGDLSDEEYHQLFLEDVKAIEFFLSSKYYAISDSAPTKADAFIYPYVKCFMNMKELADRCPGYAFVQASNRLIEYCKKIEEKMA